MAEGEVPPAEEAAPEVTPTEEPARPESSGSAESTEANRVIAELEKRITEAFLVFDTTDTRQVDVRELGTVVR